MLIKNIARKRSLGCGYDLWCLVFRVRSDFGIHKIQPSKSQIQQKQNQTSLKSKILLTITGKSRYKHSMECKISVHINKISKIPSQISIHLIIALKSHHKQIR